VAGGAIQWTTAIAVEHNCLTANLLEAYKLRSAKDANEIWYISPGTDKIAIDILKCPEKTGVGGSILSLASNRRSSLVHSSGPM
jgi:hypothetical protein